MFEYLAGRVESLPPGNAVLAAGGIGWLLQVSSRTAGRLREGEEARLFVHFAVSDTAFTLYGFADERERALFRRLLGVNGVGPTSAMGVLSAFEPDELIGVILAGDTARMTSVRGIGMKTAERLILELRDRLKDLAGEGHRRRPEAEDLARMLLDLGFRPSAARSAAEAAREALGAEAELEELLREALRAPAT